MKAKYIKQYKNRRKVLVHSIYWKFSQGIYLIKFRKGLMNIGFKKPVLKVLGEGKANFYVQLFKRTILENAK